MSRFMVIAMFLVTVYLPVSAATSGRTTIDPNAGEARSEEMVSNGPGLTQDVTYEARRKTVKAILADLSDMTGVTLKAGYNSEDWQVRDRRMNIFAKGIPLASLMNSIARAMKFKWSKSDKDGVVSYRLYMDRNVLLGAERDRYAEEERLRRRQSESRERLVAGLEATAGMSQSDMARLRVDSPYAYAMARMGWADLLSCLSAENPSAMQAFRSGEVLALDATLLPLAVQQALAEVLKRNFDLAGKSVSHQEMLDRLNGGSITINASRRGWGYDEASNIGDIEIQIPPSMVKTTFMDPESDRAKRFGAGMATLLDADTPAEREDLKDRLADDMTQAKSAQKVDLGEPLNEHPDDPALSAKVKMKVEGHEFTDALAALAGSSGFAVVSDSFEKTFWGLSFPADEIEIRAVLDKLESVCRYNWEKHDRTLEFRDRGWFKKRAAQIPDAWLEAWRKAIKDNGFLGMDELSQIAALTPDQFLANIVPDDILGSGRMSHVISQNQDILRLYASLNKQQRALVFTGQGLDLDSLPSDRLPAVEALLRRCPALTESGQEGVRLAGVSEKQGKQVQYTFRITSAGGVGSAKWRIISPEYSPLAEEKPRDGGGGK